MTAHDSLTRPWDLCGTRRLRWYVLLTLSHWVSFACAPSLPREYSVSRAAAERAYVHGHYAEAANHWQQAAEHAERAKDHDEALDRQAASLKRAGKIEMAARLWRGLATQAATAGRRAKALYELAVLELDAGQQQMGLLKLDALVTKYPDTPVAASAFRRLIALYREQDGEARFVLWAEAHSQPLSHTNLAEALAFEHARSLERTGQLEAALARYLEVARAFPYPQGAYWDDALWRASLLEEQAGRPSRALKHLARMLKEREPSHFGGSYERSAFAKAQLKRGELYRDALKNDEQALEAFLALWRDYPTSILRDDGLWAAATLAKRTGKQQLVCRLRRELDELAPESRYRGCISQLCPNGTAPGRCQDYLRRELVEAGVGLPNTTP